MKNLFKPFTSNCCLNNKRQLVVSTFLPTIKIFWLNKVRPMLIVTLLLITVLTFLHGSTFAQKQTTALVKTTHKKNKRSKKVNGVLTFAKATEKNGEEGENGPQERLDYEFNRTKDPVTNTVPKYRLIAALNQHSRSITEQRIAREKSTSTPINSRAASITGAALSIGNLSWVERGPNVSNGPGNDNNPSISGRSDALWIDTDPAHLNQAFLGGNNGGLWTCADISQSTPTWTYIDNFANIAISSICQDPTNPAILYFGTGEKLARVVGGGIWKSIDHGVSWSFMTNTANFYNVSKVLCDKHGNLYVGMVQYVKTNSNFTNGGLMRSTDGGASWSNITPTVNGINSNQVSDMVYDSSNDRMGVYMGYQYTGETQGYCYATPSAVSTSTWSFPASSSAGLGLYAQINNTTTRIRQTVMSAKGGVVWALQGYSSTGSTNGGNYTNLYYSADGGANWTLKLNISSGYFDLGQNWYALAIDCDPQSPSNNVIIGGLNPFKSTNGGSSLSQIARWTGSGQGGTPAQYVHADIHNIYYNTTAAGLNRVICMDDGGINYSADGGTTWQDRNAGLRTLEFYSVASNPADPNNYLAGAQDNGCHQFTTTGLGSTYQVSGGDGAFTAIDQLTPNNQITAYVYNQYYVCTDKGVNLNNSYQGTSIDQTGQFINPFDFDGKTKKLYAATNSGQYLRWDDPLTTKNTYPKITVPAISAVISAITVSPNLSNTIYLAAGAIVVKAVNANTASPTFTSITPSAITPGCNISSIIIGPNINDQDILVTSSSYGSNKVFLSTDGGSSWTNITGNLPDMPVNWASFYAGSSTQIYLATNLGVWYTSQTNNSSTVWQADAGIPHVSCRMIKYSDATNTLALATYGRGLWTAKTSTTPKISFFPALLATSKALSNVSNNCRLYADYSDSLQISDAPTGAATVTLSVQTGGTAVQGADFDFTTNGSFTSSATTVNFAGGTYPNKIPITIRVYNNKNKTVTLPLTANLSFAITGTTDAVASTANQNLLISLQDNSLALPTTTTTNQTVWTENWETWPGSKSSWVFSPDLSNGTANTTLFTAAGPGLSGCNNQKLTNYNIELLSTGTGGTIAYCGGLSSPVTPIFYRAVNGQGNFYTNIKVTFDYIALNGSDNDNLVYSLNNGTSWTVIQNFATQSTVKNVTVSLPAVLNNSNFLLGWSASGSNLSGFAIDNISVVADIAPPAIEIAALATTNYYVNKSTSTDAFSTGNNIFANITNASADLGCVTAAVDSAGNTWRNYFGGTRSQKSFLVTPATNASGTTYTASFYFTNAELAGKISSGLRLAKTDTSSIGVSSSSNTITVTPTTVVYNSTGVVFTGSFTGFSRYFLVDQNVVLPITLLSFTANIAGNSTLLNWVTASEFNNKEFDVQWCTDGINFTTLGIVDSKGNSTVNVTYTYIHNHPVDGENYYRLKQVDINGKTFYSKIIALKTGNNKEGEPFLYPNPAHQIITLNIGSPVSHAAIALYNADMRLLHKQDLKITGLTANIDIAQLPAGVYFLQVNKNDNPVLLRFVKE